MNRRASRFTRRSFIGATAAATGALGAPTLLRAQAKPVFPKPKFS